MPKVSEAYLEERRQRIIDAAVASFARKGFHETTMEDIGREAGLSPGLAYHYFSNKEEIIQASITESRSRIPLLSERLREQADFPGFVETVVKYVCTGLESPGTDIRWNVRLQAFARAARHPDEAETLREARGEALDLYEQYVKSGQHSGKVNPSLDARSVARVLIAFGDGLGIQLSADPDMDIWGACEVILALFDGSFRPAE